ncbi:platelet binding protein GspB-like [Sycon ciliatum]|uniref:platelet binding protein GspB-like n=1 Tax=Sycon ciliatum TaxID=27933 RepID=UPI0031F69415
MWRGMQGAGEGTDRHPGLGRRSTSRGIAALVRCSRSWNALSLLLALSCVLLPSGLGQVSDHLGDVNFRCTSLEDCRTPDGFAYCDKRSGRCDCSFSTFLHGVRCNKVCTDDRRRGQCRHGVCRQDDNDWLLMAGFCTCDAGWQIDHNYICNKPICRQECENGGYCSEPDICVCSDGFTGSRCQHKITCEDLPAPRWGRTVRTNISGYQAQLFTCPRGFNLRGSAITLCEFGRWNVPPPICHDHDECWLETHSCSKCELCINAEGTYSCARLPSMLGWVYDANTGICGPPASVATTTPPSSPTTVPPSSGMSPVPPPLDMHVGCKPTLELPLNAIEIVYDADDDDDDDDDVAHTHTSQRPPGHVTAVLKCRHGYLARGGAMCVGSGDVWLTGGFTCERDGSIVLPNVSESEGGGEPSRNMSTIALIVTLTVIGVVVPTAVIVILICYRERRRGAYKYTAAATKSSSSPAAIGAAVATTTGPAGASVTVAIMSGSSPLSSSSSTSSSSSSSSSSADNEASSTATKSQTIECHYVDSPTAFGRSVSAGIAPEPNVFNFRQSTPGEVVNGNGAGAACSRLKAAAAADHEADAQHYASRDVLTSLPSPMTNPPGRGIASIAGAAATSSGARGNAERQSPQKPSSSSTSADQVCRHYSNSTEVTVVSVDADGYEDMVTSPEHSVQLKAYAHASSRSASASPKRDSRINATVAPCDGQKQPPPAPVRRASDPASLGYKVQLGKFCSLPRRQRSVPTAGTATANHESARRSVINSLDRTPCSKSGAAVTADGYTSMDDDINVYDTPARLGTDGNSDGHDADAYENVDISPVASGCESDGQLTKDDGPVSEENGTERATQLMKACVHAEKAVTSEHSPAAVQVETVAAKDHGAAAEAAVIARSPLGRKKQSKGGDGGGGGGGDGGGGGCGGGGGDAPSQDIRAAILAHLNTLSSSTSTSAFLELSETNDDRADTTTTERGKSRTLASSSAIASSSRFHEGRAGTLPRGFGRSRHGNPASSRQRASILPAPPQKPNVRRASSSRDVVALGSKMAATTGSDNNHHGYANCSSIPSLSAANRARQVEREERVQATNTQHVSALRKNFHRLSALQVSTLNTARSACASDAPSTGSAVSSVTATVLTSSPNYAEPASPGADTEASKAVVKKTSSSSSSCAVDDCGYLRPAD